MDMHPLHLHGSSFHVVEQGFAQLNTTTGQFVANNPNVQCNDYAECTCEEQNGTCKRINMRLVKNTIQIPRGGYMRIRFRATNPGVWLFHCHTEPHSNRGMSLMIHVAEDRIQSAYSSSTILTNKWPLLITSLVVSIHYLT